MFYLIFFKSSILVQITLYFSNNFSSFIRKDVNLKLLPLFPSLTLNILTLVLSKLMVLELFQILFQSNLLELAFVLTNFEITVLSTLTSQIFTGFSEAYNASFPISVSPNLNIIIL